MNVVQVQNYTLARNYSPRGACLHNSPTRAAVRKNQALIENCLQELSDLGFWLGTFPSLVFTTDPEIPPQRDRPP
jgi:hypothetical protein